jgi:hypothetical protein
MNNRELRIGERCVIEILESSGCFQGLGSVSVDGVQLRSPRRPMFVEIRNPSGIQLTDYRLLDIQSDGDETVLSFGVSRVDSGLMEWMLHTVRNRYNTSDWSLGPQPAPDTSLELVLRPVERAFRGETYRGFSYQYRYRSESIPIYKILDRGTWEIGGRIEGNAFWLRNSTVDSIYEFDGGDEPYSTEWYLPPIHQPNIFQFFPLQTQLPGFTLTAAQPGILVTRPTQVAHIRSLFERLPGSGELAHWHEHCGDLAHEFDTSPMEVLFRAGNTGDRTGVYNSWEAVRDDTWTSLHAQVGLKQERATSYGVMEEWGVPDLDYYLNRGLPKMLAAGIKTIMLPSEFENNMNTWGVSNMCCQVDLKVAETVGPEKLANLCKTSNENGTNIEMWGNTAISTLSYILDTRNGPQKGIDFLPRENSVMEALQHARAPWIRNASGAIEADHYTPVFCVLNLREPAVRAWWNKSWKEAYDRYGVRGIFVDSSFNMSSDKFHWVQNDEFDRPGGATIDQTESLGDSRPTRAPKQAILSQYHAYLDLLADMQEMGYAICGEDVGVFGTSRSGPDVATRMRCLPLWLDSYCAFDSEAINRAGVEPSDIYFRGLAYRVVWFIYWDVQRDALSFKQFGGDESDDPTAWHISIIKAFNEAGSFCDNRKILEDERGVVYDGPEGSALWAFSGFEYPLQGNAVARDLLTKIDHIGPVLHAQKHHVYLIRIDENTGSD